MSYAIGRYAKAWNDLSDSWYENRFNTGNTENEEVTESENIEEGVISNFKQKHLADRIGKTHAKMMTDKNPSEKDIEKTRKQYDKDWKEIHNLAKKEQEKELAKTRKNNEKANKYSKKADEHIKKANFASTKADNLIKQATDKYLNKTNESENLKEEYSEKLGGDPEDFLSDMTKIKSCIMEIGKHTIATHLAEEVIMNFLETCDSQIAMVKSRYLGESEENKKIKPGMIVRYASGWCKPEERKYYHVVKEERSPAPDGTRRWLIDTLNSGLTLGSTEVVDEYMIEPVGDLTIDNITKETLGEAEEPSTNTQEYKVGDIVKVPYKYGSYTPGEYTDAPIIDIDDNHFVTVEIPSKLEVTMDQLKKWNTLEESEKLNEDDRIMQDQNVVDIMNSYSSRNNHLKYKIEGNSAIYEDGTEITFYLNDNSEIEYTIRKDNNTTEPKLASQGLTESEELKEDESNVYKMKDCTTDVDIINALEGETLELDDMEDWERLKNLARSLAGSQGFYGRLLRDMEEAEEDLDETSFPMYL